MTRDIKTLIREAAANTGFMEKVPVLDAAGKPTGQYEHRWGKDGELGYLDWLARNHPGYFASLYGRLIPLDVNQKSERGVKLGGGLNAKGIAERQAARERAEQLRPLFADLAGIASVTAMPASPYSTKTGTSPGHSANNNNNNNSSNSIDTGKPDCCIAQSGARSAPAARASRDGVSIFLTAPSIFLTASSAARSWGRRTRRQPDY